MVNKDDDAIGMFNDDEDSYKLEEELPDVELESWFKSDFDQLLDAIHTYADNPYNFRSTLDVNRKLDIIALSKIKDFASKKFGLVDVQPSVNGNVATLTLIGFRHLQAKPAIAAKFFKDADDTVITLPSHWEDVDKIK